MQAACDLAHVHVYLLLLCKPDSAGFYCCCLDHIYLLCLVVQLPKKDHHWFLLDLRRVKFIPGIDLVKPSSFLTWELQP